MDKQEESNELYPWADGPHWTVAQERAYQELLGRGVVGLSEKKAFEEVGWFHPLLWLVIGFCIGTSSFFLGGELSWGSLRAYDDVFTIRGLRSDYFPVVFGFIGTMVAFTFGGRALAGIRNSGSAFQFIGETLILTRPFGESLLRYAVAGGKEWSRIRRRWVGRLWTFLAIPLAFHVWASARAYSTYRAVFEEGIREIQFGQVNEYPWEDLRTIRTYCDESRKRFFYKLRFAGGAEFELIRDDKHGVAALRDIDRKLVEMGKRKEGLTPQAAARCAGLWRKVEERSAIEAILSR